MELKEHKIYKLTISYAGDNVDVIVAISHLNYPQKDMLQYVKLTGEIGQITINRILKATSTRSLSPETRNLLISLSKNIKQENEERIRHQRQISIIHNAIDQHKKDLIKASGVFSDNIFNNKLVALFQKYTGKNNLDVTCWCKDYVWLSEYKDIEKWYNPEKFPFLYREYDDTIHVGNEKEADKFAERNAPSIIPLIKRVSKKQKAVLSLGDKWLGVNMQYKILIPYGYTQKSLDFLESKIKEV